MLTGVVVNYRFTTPEVKIWRHSKEYLISDGSMSTETVTRRPNPKLTLAWNFWPLTYS